MSENAKSFAKVFFKFYDSKILSGEITFSQTGMKKDDFTRLCTDDTYVLSAEEIERIAANMHLTQTEISELLAFVSKTE